MRFAADEFDVPIALISLVDSDRQWFKARVGLEACETGRDISFCGHAVHAGELLMVENALRRLQEKHFDALLADIGEGVEGVSLVQRVRGGAAGCPAGLPIALMAGNCDAGTIALFKTLDVRRIMLKPFKVKTAIEVLATLAGKPLPA